MPWSAPSPSTRPPSTPTDALLARAATSGTADLGRLVGRYLPSLHRWAHGRLHPWARSVLDTADIVQDVLIRVLPRLRHLDLDGQHALGAYLREAVRNRIHDEHRRLARHGSPATLPESLVDPGPSPLEQAIAGEMEERYRRACALLPSADRELIVGHVELGYSHQQLGCMTRRSPNAARMALSRALLRLAEHMHEE